MTLTALAGRGGMSPACLSMAEHAFDQHHRTIACGEIADQLIET